MPSLKHQPPHRPRPRAGSRNHARRLDPVSQAPCVVSSSRNCSKRHHQTQITSENHNRHYDSNQQYSITALTDGGGSIVERYAYSAYGQVTIFDDSGSQISNSEISNRYTYTGREWDDGLSLYHYRARMYDAVGGRFVSRDPIRYQFGFNLFQFVKGQVLRSADPFGLFEISMGGAVYKGVGGGASFSLSDRASPCCDASGAIIPNGKKFIDLKVTGEAGIGIGGHAKFKVGKFGFDLRAEVVPAKFVDELNLSLENETCGKFDFGCVSRSLQISGQHNFEVSGSASAFGFGLSFSLNLKGTVSMTVDVKYCPANGGYIKSTLCGGVTGLIMAKIDHPFNIFDVPKPWEKTLDDARGGNPLKGGCFELANINFEKYTKYRSAKC